MSKERELRHKYHNEWPNKFLFPAESQLSQRLADNNLQQVFVPARLRYSDDPEFQTLLSHLIEALDQLPYKPDVAFDFVWKSLDAEFFRLKDELSAPQHESRFDTFCKKIVSDQLTCKAFYSLIGVVPMQTCEWAAKRILGNNQNPDENSDKFLKRVRPVMTQGLYDAFLQKYIPDFAIDRAKTQRRAGAFLRKAMLGSPMTIGSQTFSLTQEQSVAFLIAVVMAQFRNERFHGATFPPFRSSAARLKTYAHSYFLFLVAYALLLEVFLYREFNVIARDEAINAIGNNKCVYVSVFGKVMEE